MTDWRHTELFREQQTRIPAYVRLARDVLDRPMYELDADALSDEDYEDLRQRLIGAKTDLQYTSTHEAAALINSITSATLQWLASGRTSASVEDKAVKEDQKTTALRASGEANTSLSQLAWLCQEQLED